MDRFGAARMLVWTAAICLAGTLLTSLSPGLAGMAVGRLQFGIGGETCRRPGSRRPMPTGYQPMMVFFFDSGALGFATAMALWLKAGRRHHEIPQARILVATGGA